LVEGPDFLRIVLQLAHGCTDFGLEVRLVGDHHAADSVGLEVLPDQFVGIAIGRIWRKIKQLQPADTAKPEPAHPVESTTQIGVFRRERISLSCGLVPAPYRAPARVDASRLSSRRIVLFAW
jgi:hypothetical protein